MTLPRCLLETPQRRSFIDACDMRTQLELWVVLEEDPEGHRGYCVAFDDSVHLFGLATEGFAESPVFLGYYGTFVETLEAM